MLQIKWEISGESTNTRWKLYQAETLFSLLKKLEIHENLSLRRQV